MNRLRSAPLRALLLAAVLLTAFQFTGGASPAHAGTAFFVAYGAGLEPGATVDILVGDNLCGQVVADAGGDWVATIGPDAPVLICAAVAGETPAHAGDAIMLFLTTLFLFCLARTAHRIP